MFIHAGGGKAELALATSSVKLEFPFTVLVRLLAGGHLHAAEFRCLDPLSHQAVRRALLQSCLASLNEVSHARQDTEL
jgi:hypothetical protein